MDLGSIFYLQQKKEEGILSRIINTIRDKDKFIAEIQNNAIKDDFTSLYIISRNRDIFSKRLVARNDFRLNAISEIINIMNIGEGDTEFQNEIINYLMQVRENNFIIYVLDNLLYREEYFSSKNIQVFISTISSEFKASKLDDEQKKELQSIIYKHFLNVKTEIQEALLRMLEVIKIVDLYKTAELFNNSEGHIIRKLLDTIKSNISYENGSETIDTLNLMNGDSAIDENNMAIFIIALDKYESNKIIDSIMQLKKNSIVYEYAISRVRELMDEKIIDDNKFSKVLKMI